VTGKGLQKLRQVRQGFSRGFQRHSIFLFSVKIPSHFTVGKVILSLESPAGIHHLRAGVGMSQRSSHYRTLPLCDPHHQTGGYGVAIHEGQETWEENFATEEELLEKVMEQV